MLKKIASESQSQKIKGLTDSPESRASEYRRRNRTYNEKSVTPGAVPDVEKLGWSVYKKFPTRFKMRQPRQDDENLENRFWCCLYKLGFDDLNIGRNFKIDIKVGSSGLQRQIDAFAKDDETVVVAECKTAETNKKKSLQTDLGEFESLKKPIADAIRLHYGSAFKPKIIWCFVTDQIEWTSNDLLRAKQHNISVINSRDLDYIDEIAKVLGPVARHQFKATYLDGVKIPALQNKKLPAIRCRVGGQNAFVFSAKANDILPIAFVNHRDFRDPRGTPAYQRLVNPGRLRKIASFLEDGGYFPNSILVNFHKKPRFEQSAISDDKDIQFGHLYLPETHKSCWVIDGQHRLYGCALLPDANKQPTLMFIAFSGIGATEEANLFATINREQKKVDKKLLDELDGDLK